jgi:hypothetical protein
MPLTNGSGDADLDPVIFITNLQDANKKQTKKKFCITFLQHFSKIKSQIEVIKTVEIKVFLTIFA